MKERDTSILPVRIKKSLLAEVNGAVVKSRQKSRNAWLNWAIKNGLRPHRRKNERD